MIKNIILFGPPGVGKSTLIGILKTKGYSAIDLEDLYPNKVRFQIPNLVKGAFIGAADLNPRRKYSGAYKVLIAANQDTYESRRAVRDAQVEGKSNQAAHQMEDWKRGTTYDLILDTSHHKASESADKLIAFFRKELAHEQN